MHTFFKFIFVSIKWVLETVGDFWDRGAGIVVVDFGIGVHKAAVFPSCSSWQGHYSVCDDS